MTDPKLVRTTILDLLAERDEGKTICPSDVARKIDERSFRRLMPDVRSAAAELVEEGRVEVTQGGRVVDPATARGPIRIRLTASG